MVNLLVNQEVLNFVKELKVDVEKLDFSYVQSEVNGNDYNVSLHTKYNLKDPIELLKKYFDEFTFYSLREVYNCETDDEGHEVPETSRFSHNHLFFSFRKALNVHLN